MRNALLSVYDKTGIVDFAKGLIDLGWNIISSGGTAKVISEAGLPVLDVAKIVGGKAILGHRVVTLSREVHAGILSTDSVQDRRQLKRLKIPRIDLVCVDMYPLEEEIAKSFNTYASVIEKTDIGGPTMLRSGAKGGRVVICDPKDREKVLNWLQLGEMHDNTIRKLAAKAEFVVANYVLASALYLGEGDYAGFTGILHRILKYGENARQRDARHFVAKTAKGDPLSLDKFELVEGASPSYVNMTDIDRVLATATRIGRSWLNNFLRVPRLAIAVKHGNACGVGVADNPYEALIKMVSGDPEAISGGIILVNFEVNAEYADLLRSHLMPNRERRVLDSVIAPSFTPEAIEILARKKTGKCRLLANPALGGESLGRYGAIDSTLRFRQVRGGFLVQDGDSFIFEIPMEWQGNLSPRIQEDLVFAWAIGSTSNSNTITIVRHRKLLGQGVNQRSRKMAAKVALLYTEEYGHDTEGAVAYSDSFFPFADGPEVLAKAGIKTIFATSGSIRDKEVAKACEEWGVTLLTLPDTEARGFFGH